MSLCEFRRLPAALLGALLLAPSTLIAHERVAENADAHGGGGIARGRSIITNFLNNPHLTPTDYRELRGLVGRPLDEATLTYLTTDLGRFVETECRNLEELAQAKVLGESNPRFLDTRENEAAYSRAIMFEKVAHIFSNFAAAELEANPRLKVLQADVIEGEKRYRERMLAIRMERPLMEIRSTGRAWAARHDSIVPSLEAVYGADLPPAELYEIPVEPLDPDMSVDQLNALKDYIKRSIKGVIDVRLNPHYRWIILKIPYPSGERIKVPLTLDLRRMWEDIVTQGTGHTDDIGSFAGGPYTVSLELIAPGMPEAHSAQAGND